MTPNTLSLWMALQFYVNPPDKITHDELLGVSITLLTKDDQGDLTLRTVTLPGRLEEEK